MIKLWYTVEGTHWSTATTPFRNFTVSRRFNLDDAVADAVTASITCDGTAVFEMPAGHVTHECKNGEVIYAEAGAGR
jgi:hypothetical protein